MLRPASLGGARAHERPIGKPRDIRYWHFADILGSVRMSAFGGEADSQIRAKTASSCTQGAETPLIRSAVSALTLPRSKRVCLASCFRSLRLFGPIVARVPRPPERLHVRGGGESGCKSARSYRAGRCRRPVAPRAQVRWLRMSAFGTLQTSILMLSMSALGGEADIPDARSDVR